MVVLGLATSHHEEKLQVRFHPHTVWSSLARTDSDGFLAPCLVDKHEKAVPSEKGRTKPSGDRPTKLQKFYISSDVPHTRPAAAGLFWKKRLVSKSCSNGSP